MIFPQQNFLTFQTFQQYSRSRAFNLILTGNANSQLPYVWAGIKDSANKKNQAQFFDFLGSLQMISNLTQDISNFIQSDITEQKELLKQKQLLQLQLANNAHNQHETWEQKLMFLGNMIFDLQFIYI